VSFMLILFDLRTPARHPKCVVGPGKSPSSE
jgi:hypothetical protein